MPVNTGYGTLSIGKDIAVVITLSTGRSLTLSVITNFTKKQDTAKLKSKGIDGIIRHANVPDGWSGSFDLDRAGSQLDDYFADLESSYYNGTTINNVTITETIAETDGSISEYRYSGAALEFADAGGAEVDKFVRQKMNWMASKREKKQ